MHGKEPIASAGGDVLNKREQNPTNRIQNTYTFNIAVAIAKEVYLFKLKTQFCFLPRLLILFQSHSYYLSYHEV